MLSTITTSGPLSAAIADLGFRYEVSWVEGVRRTVAWLDANNKVDNSDNDTIEDEVIAAWSKLSEDAAAQFAGRSL